MSHQSDTSNFSPLGLTPKSWQMVKLKEITSKIGSGATPKGGEMAYLKSRHNYALIRSQNVFDRRFDENGLAFISDSQASELKNASVQQGDLLLNITGDGITFARACLVPTHVLPACVNQHVTIIRSNPVLCLPEYLLAYLTHPDIKGYIESFNAGGSRRAITKGHIESFLVPLPSLDEQRIIAGILSALDDKIEVNQHMNATLESIARAVFRQWFMENENFEGWKKGTVGEVIKRISVGKKYDFKTVESKGSVPVLDQSHFTIIGYHNEDPGVVATLDNPVIVFSNHRCYTDIIHFPFSAIQNVLPFVGDGVDTRWLYHATDGLIEYSEYKGHWPEFISKVLVIPPKELTNKFGEFVKPIHMKIMKNKEESRTLGSLRDSLLPKLMRGEVRVKHE